MKRWIYFILISVFVTRAVGASVSDLVEQASQAEGKQYLALRDQIVAQGNAAVAELQAILGNTGFPWQQRVTAGICLERIQRLPDIQAVINKKWREDPAVKDLAGWRSRMRYPIKELWEDGLLSQHLAVASVPFYCLELIWKQTREFNPVIGRGDMWRGIASDILLTQSNSFLPDVLVARLQAQMNLNSAEIDGYYMDLVAIGRHQDLPLLFDARLKQFRDFLRGYEEAREKFRQQFPDIKYPYPGGGFEPLFALATPEDKDWIMEKMRDIPLSPSDRRVYEAYLARVGDTTPPTITILGPNPATVECGGAYTDAGATAIDETDGDLTSSIIVSNTVNTAVVGQYSVSYTVSDAAGNEARGTRIVNVVDTTPPQISCPAPVTAGVNAGACFASAVSLGSPTASDTCGEVGLTNNAPATFPLGNTPVVWVATDSAGNTGTCTQLVTVVDNQPPSISCPPDVIVSAPPGQPFVPGVVLGEPIVGENCSVASLTNNAPSTFPVGSTIVIWTVTDGSGNSNSCPQTVTVQAAPGACSGDGSIIVEYWLREGTGNIAINSGTDGATGNSTLTNGAVFNTDAPPGREGCGGSIQFPNTGSGPGTPAAKTANSYNPLAGAERFTVMAWVKRQSSAANKNMYARIVSDEHPRGIGANDGLALRFSGQDGQLALRVNTDEAETSITGGLIPPNEGQWHHIAVVYDGTRPATNTLTRHVHFYVDGVQRGLGNELPSQIVASNNYPLTVGNASAQADVNTAMVGKIAEVRVLRNFAPDAVGINKTNPVIACYMNDTGDFDPPTITCPSNLTVSTTSGLRYATGVSLGTPVTADNCAVATVVNDASAGLLIGTNLVTWTATDSAGLAATCPQIVVVTWAGTECAGDGSPSSVAGEYRFNEGSGSATVNAGINGPAGNAVLTNGAVFSLDRPPTSTSGWSMSLPNTGTGSTTPAVETAAGYDPLAGAGRFTIMAWVKRESANAASNQSARVVSDTSSTTLTSTTAGVEFRFTGAAGSLALRVNGQEVSTSAGGIAPNSNSWHHVAVVYDGTRPATNTLTRNVHFYVDGVQRGDGNVLQNEIGAANTNRLTVGNSSVGRGAPNALVGKIDNVLILRDFAPDAVGNAKTNTAIKCYMDRDGF